MVFNIFWYTGYRKVCSISRWREWSQQLFGKASTQGRKSGDCFRNDVFDGQCRQFTDNQRKQR